MVSDVLVDEPSCVEPEAEAELVLPSGTEPRTAMTSSLGKQRRLTPLVVFSGMAAQTVVPLPLQPTISQDPSAEQWAYSASTQAYWPGLHAESAEISVNAAFSLMASARFEAYCEEETIAVPVGMVEVITDVGMKSSGVPVGETLLLAEDAVELVMLAP